MAEWQDTFRRRMRGFEAAKPREGATALSIKVRVDSGCFHREHSPHAYQIIDEQLDIIQEPDFAFEEHESGPELLVYNRWEEPNSKLLKRAIKDLDLNQI